MRSMRLTVTSRPRFGASLAGLLLASAACSGAPVPSGAPVQSEPAAEQTAVPTAAASNAPATPGPTPNLPPMGTLDDFGAQAFILKPSPDFITAADGFAYIGAVGGNPGWDNVSKVDSKGEIVATYTLPGETCGGMEVGFGALWSATCTGATGLARIDVESKRLTGIAVQQPPMSETSIGLDEHGVWMIDGARLPRELLRVDPTTNAVSGSWKLPGYPNSVRAGLGGVWITDPVANVLLHFDPAAEEVVATIPVGKQPQFLAVGEGAVWTMDQADGTISRVDPETDSVVAVIALGELVGGGEIAAGGGYLWLRGSRTLLFQIDPETNTIVGRFGPNSGSGGVAVDGEVIWVTAHDIATVWRFVLE
jgi:streptogramin lyase